MNLATGALDFRLRFNTVWNPPEIDWHSLHWWDTSLPDYPEFTRLLTTISIAGYPIHLEAYEVRRDAEGILRTIAYADDMDLVYTGLMSEGEWRTFEIAGRQYLLLGQPFGA